MHYTGWAKEKCTMTPFLIQGECVVRQQGHIEHYDVKTVEDYDCI